MLSDKEYKFIYGIFKREIYDRIQRDDINLYLLVNVRGTWWSQEKLDIMRDVVAIHFPKYLSKLDAMMVLK